MKKYNVGRNDLCPCGSGRKFKKCCVDKNFDWYIDDSEVIKRKENIKLTDELIEILEKNEEEFYRVFGRHSRGDEPIFFNQICKPTKNSYSDYIKEMYEHGIEPQFIYATLKTDRIITKENLKNITEKEHDKWLSAVQEYHTRLKNNETEDEILGLKTLYDELQPEIERLIFRKGLILFKHNDNYIKKNHLEATDLVDYFAFLMSRTIKSIHSILSLLNNHACEDSYAIIRNIYEIYIRIIYFGKKKDEFANYNKIKIGLKTGVYELATSKKGKIIYNMALNKYTNEIQKIEISNYNMIKESDYENDLEIFLLLYNYLCKYSHPDISVISKYMRGKKFSPSVINDKCEPAVITMFLGIIIFENLLPYMKVKKIDMNEAQEYILEQKTALLDKLNINKVIVSSKIQKEIIKRLKI